MSYNNHLAKLNEYFILRKANNYLFKSYSYDELMY